MGFVGTSVGTSASNQNPVLRKNGESVAKWGQQRPTGRKGSTLEGRKDLESVMSTNIGTTYYRFE